MKLCISFCFVKFQVCPLFQTHTISSQLLRNPALLSLGGGFVLWVRMPEASAKRCGSSATVTSQNVRHVDGPTATTSLRCFSLKCPLRDIRVVPTYLGN